MSYTAHVTRCATDARKAKRFDVGPILAVNEWEAAQHAALVVARRLFPNGEVSFFQRAGDRYLAVAGAYRFQNGYGVNVGVSLCIRVDQE